MNNTAEQKALEAYPPIPLNVSLVDYNSFKRTFYAKGYDKAFQDFLEKAEEFLKNRTMAELCLDSESRELVDDFVDGFKNYMKNEM